MAAAVSSRFALLRASLSLKSREKTVNNRVGFSNLHHLRERRGLSSESTLAKVNEQTNTQPESLTISDNCVTRLKAIQSDDQFLRISVDGGGCSGFQYTFTMEANLQPDDRMMTKSGVRVVVDEISFEYVKGSTVDYNQELIRSSFRIVSNPRAVQGCSCGASFAVKL